MKNKKGFTLIELLAVIVILAIIALIATPIVLNMINSARKSAAKSAALGYIDSIEYYTGFNQLKDEIEGYNVTPPTGECEKTSSGWSNNTCKTFYDEVDKKSKGAKPKEAKITIENGKVKNGSTFKFNGYTLSYDGKDVTIGGGSSSSNNNNNNNSNEVYLYTQFGLHDSTTTQYTLPVDIYSLREEDGTILTQGFIEYPVALSSSGCAAAEQTYSGYHVTCHKEYSKGDTITYDAYLKKTGIPNQIAEHDIYTINYEHLNSAKEAIKTNNGFTDAELNTFLNAEVVTVLGEDTKSECEQRLLSEYDTLEHASQQGFTCVLKYHSGDTYTKIIKYESCLVHNNKEVCTDLVTDMGDEKADYISDKVAEFQETGLTCQGSTPMFMCVDNEAKINNKILYDSSPEISVNVGNKVMRCLTNKGIFMCLLRTQ